MRIVEHRLPFIVTTVEDHAFIKSEILANIAKLGVHSTEAPNGSERVSNTDWYLNPNIPREYLSYIAPIIKNHCAQVGQALKYDRPVLCSTVWFQQYKPGDWHGWHLHGDALFSNVYYVDLPEGASKTSFKLFDEEFEIDVKEGEIVSFPSFLLHCSKPNKSINSKTVIAFNTTVE